MRNSKDADLVLTLKGQYNKLPPYIREAEEKGLPVKVVRSNTLVQLIKAVIEISPPKIDDDSGYMG